MSHLVVTPNVVRPDELYEMLIELYRELDVDRSALVSAKLILLLSNHIGDEEVIREALRIARQETGGAE